MPITLPVLDDRRWEDLVEESTGLIPSFAPEWTNHNPSDPGITLIELFAYLAEILLYRTNRVSDESLRVFLVLINGPRWESSPDLTDDVRATLSSLRKRGRAVTARDFEAIAIGVNDELGDGAREYVARAHCLPRRNLEAGSVSVDVPGHVTVVILSGAGGRPSDWLLKQVRSKLDQCRMITTRVHVVAPRFVAVGVQLTLVTYRGSDQRTVRREAIAALEKFFNPLAGGADGKGWPFGRDVYVSELYQILSSVSGVRSVRRKVHAHTQKALDELKVDAGDSARLKRNRLGEIEAVDLTDDELVKLAIEPDDLEFTDVET